MSENNSLSLKDLISESLLRDLILFSFIYILVMGQMWETILFLLFPLIAFAFSLFFRILDTGKHRIEFSGKPIIFKPFGLEDKNATRLNFCAIFLLILIFWLGAESLYHPQLIDDYIFYFILIFIFIYSFSFFWLFIDLWKYSRIELNINENEHTTTNKRDSLQFKDLDRVISLLKIKTYKKISIINFAVFLSINIINVVFAVLLHYELFTGIEFQYNLPGTGMEDSEPILLSLIIYGMLITPPALTTCFLTVIYRDIKDLSEGKLNKALEKLPKSVQIKIIENLRTIMNE